MIQEEFRHIWSDEEGSDGSIPVTEYYAFRDLPSDDEITAVLERRAQFIPRSECYVRKIAEMWRKHLTASTNYPITEINSDCNQLLYMGLVLGMSKSNEIIRRQVSRAIEIPLITLARAREGGKTFQMPDVTTIRQRLAAKSS
jgi:hypothetical protein